MEKPDFENVVLDAVESLRVLQFSCPAFQSNHTWHFHPEYELTLIIKGEGQRFVGDSIEPFYPGDLVLIGPNVPHCWISSDEATQNEMFVLQFNPMFLGSNFYAIPEAKGISSLFNDSTQAIHFYEYSPEVSGLIDKIRDTDGLSRIAHLLLLCEELAGCKQRLLVSDSYVISQDSRGVDRLTAALDYVKKHLSEEIKQPDVAAAVHMAPQSFSRFFKAQTGRTFISLVNELRIAEACHLLATTRKDILEIALSCGYGNISHFNRKFLENKQVTPSKYREIHRLRRASSAATKG